MKDMNGNLPNILIDEAQINQVILNMAINSKQAMSSGGLFKIKTDVVKFVKKIYAGQGRRRSCFALGHG